MFGLRLFDQRREKVARTTVAVGAADAYNLWAATYPARAHNPLMEAEQVTVASCLAGIRATRALDAGTGTGRYLPLLSATGAHTVIGLDRSPAMLARVDARWPRVQADALQLPFAPASFDLINASLMAGDVAQLDPWVEGLASLLMSRGHLIYSDFHPGWSARGWQRTFTLENNDVVVLPFHPHTLADHRRAATDAGLRVLAVHEVSVSAATGPAAAAFRREWGDAPLAVVVHVCRDEGS